MEDRRISPRIFVFCRAYTSQNKFLGYIADISKTGVKLIAYNPIPEEEKIDITIKTPEDEISIEFSARVGVIWKELYNEDITIMGATFIEPYNEHHLTQLLDSFKSAVDTYALDVHWSIPKE